MKLLITTQTIDRTDPILGFFHEWVALLARRFEHIEVMCLAEGEHDLPKNVAVHSLGKEKGARSRFAYASAFLKLVRAHRDEYDVVFVHMNPEYLLLAGALWKAWGKKIAFWYNHPAKNLRYVLGSFFADRILYTSSYAASANSPRATQMSAGVDTELFSPQPVPRNRSTLYMQGRIMPSKRVDLALAAFALVRARIPTATFAIVGPELDNAYATKLRSTYGGLIKAGAVTFLGAKSNVQTPALYSAHGVAINLAGAGHFDKTALEPMACETPVVLTSEAFQGLVPTEWIVRDTAETLAAAIIKIMQLPEDAYRALGQTLREAVVEKQSLSLLGDQLFTQLSQLPSRDVFVPIRFLAAGALGAAINIGLTAFLAAYTTLHYVVIVSTAFAIATIASFFLQKFVTFKERTVIGSGGQLAQFVLLALINVCVNDAIVYGLVHVWGVSWLVLFEAIASVVIAVYSFFLYRYGIFRNAVRHEVSL